MAAALWVILFTSGLIQTSYSLKIDEVNALKIVDVGNALDAIESTRTTVNDIRMVMAHHRATAQSTIYRLYQIANVDISETESTCESVIDNLADEAINVGANITDCLTKVEDIAKMTLAAQEELVGHLFYYSKLSTDNFLASFENTTMYYDFFYETLNNIDACDSIECLNLLEDDLTLLVASVNAKFHDISQAFEVGQQNIEQGFEYTVQNDTDTRLTEIRNLTSTILDCIKSKM